MGGRRYPGATQVNDGRVPIRKEATDGLSVASFVPVVTVCLQAAVKSAMPQYP